MNLTDAVGVTFREVRETTHNGGPARVVVGARRYATDVGDLWDALTNAERIPRWFMPISGELKLGGHYALEGNASGKITKCDPPEALDLTWEFGGNISWVTVRLTPDTDGARLTLKHIMAKDEASEAHWKQYGPGATGVGWDLSFLGLALYFDNGGGDLDREQIEAWMTSKDGKAFMRNCADGWGKAHVASGEPSDSANAMARNTGDFYTGA